VLGAISETGNQIGTGISRPSLFIRDLRDSIRAIFVFAPLYRPDASVSPSGQSGFRRIPAQMQSGVSEPR
jgi:hypothetical protein